MSKALLCLSVCLLLATLSEGQRPFYAPRPWYDKYGPQDQGGSTGAPPTSTVAPSNNGLGDRLNQFLVPVENNVSFKYYNNVPIEGPDVPCIGCVYRLTRNGFVMVRT